MPLPTTRLALERLLVRRARQRAASIVRAKKITEKKPEILTAEREVPQALRRYDAVAVKRLIAAGERRGYITFEDANQVLPESEVSADDIEAIVEAIYNLGFELREG
jgi:RNA polymerase primary sigma factor